MSTKYHLSKNGYYTACNATVRPCPRGASGHISEQEYQTLVAEGSVQVRQSIEAPADSYYTEAREVYERVHANAALQDQLEAETQAYADKLYKEAGLDPKKDTWYSIDTRAVTAKDEALKRLRQLYVDEGVDPRKAGYIISDLRENKKLVPSIRKNDRYDKDIEAKTTTAAEKAKNDPEFTAAVERYNAAAELQQKHRKVADERDKFRRARALELGTNGIVSHVSERELELAKEKLIKATALKKAGVPDNARPKAVSSVRSDNLVVDATGRIKNAWLQNEDGSVERIIGYEPPPGPLTYGSPSGHLLTDKGTQVKGGLHYANYTRYSQGTQNIIISEMSGTPLKTDVFSIYTEIDSGD